mmetsp:Transcript_13571/g.20647  ORF Transcript_13571/g.20647 Transcript_13571/m.20647 type:complete len:260 (+) Transcript_13571:122-901(+)|eukprot:CAMPEP_0178908688 /NCGR_PEP_ID=MMETSP0786-20121207/8062_1 /TAXON_ID=186022 /ORGANISM="Thalassionema frauenfeldii, Strain CCMP 1798" /LENGTH=259 /DNA_ID=CAMNT_0020580619 /DNA_START=63 /DNA_END=842 /DNA_ORIENTATION=+
MLSHSRRVAFTTHQDENAGVIRNKPTSVNPSINTPSTNKRTAFGDISNRKHSQSHQSSKPLNTPSRRVALGDISNKKSSKQSSVSKQRNGLFSTKKSAKKTNNNIKILPARAFNATPFSKTDNKSITYKTPSQPPVEDIDFCSRRPFNPFDEYESDDDKKIENLSIYESDDEYTDSKFLAANIFSKAKKNDKISVNHLNVDNDSEKLFLDNPSFTDYDFNDCDCEFDSVMAQATNSSLDLSMDADIHVLGGYPMDDLSL